MSDRSAAATILFVCLIAWIYIAFGSGNEPTGAYFVPVPALVLAAGLYYRNEQA